MAVVTWNPLDKDPAIQLIGGSLTAWIDAIEPLGSVYPAVRATHGKSSGKVYWEVDVSATRYDATFKVGMVLATMSLDNTYNDDGLVFWQHYVTGYGCMCFGHTNLGASGQTGYCGTGKSARILICIAADFDAKKIWFSEDEQWIAYTWGGSDYGDPVAGTNSPIYNWTGTPTFYPWVQLRSYVDDDEVTAHFALADMAYAPPAGYEAYGDAISEIEAEISESVVVSDAEERSADYLAEIGDNAGASDEYLVTNPIYEVQEEGATVGEQITATSPIDETLEEGAEVGDEITVTDLAGVEEEEVAVSDEITVTDLGGVEEEDIAVEDAVYVEVVSYLRPYNSQAGFRNTTPKIFQLDTTPTLSIDEEIPGFDIATRFGMVVDEEIPGFNIETNFLVTVLLRVDGEIPGFDIESSFTHDNKVSVDEEIPGFDIKTNFINGRLLSVDEYIPGFDIDANFIQDLAMQCNKEIPGFNIRTFFRNEDRFEYIDLKFKRSNTGCEV